MEWGRVRQREVGERRVEIEIERDTTQRRDNSHPERNVRREKKKESIKRLSGLVVFLYE